MCACFRASLEQVRCKRGDNDRTLDLRRDVIWMVRERVKFINSIIKRRLRVEVGWQRRVSGASCVGAHESILVVGARWYIIPSVINRYLHLQSA